MVWDASMRNGCLIALTVAAVCSCEKPAPIVAPASAGETSAPAVMEESVSATGGGDAVVNGRTRPSPRPPDKKHPVPPPQEFEFAKKLEDKPGFVTSPFNGKVIDVQGIPPGTLVADPSYPPAERRYFRVPE